MKRGRLATLVVGSMLALLACGPARTVGEDRPPAVPIPAPATLKPSAEAGASLPEGSPPEVNPPSEVQLRFELEQRAFPSPLVRGTVGGEPTWMLVDTGASRHVIAGWLARKAKLDVRNFGERGTDHAGRTFATARVEKPSLAIDGWGALADRPTLVAEVPDDLAQLGIGVVLSPQLLGGDNALVLDLARKSMRLLTPAQAEEELGNRGGADPFGAVDVCEVTDGPVRGLAFVVPVMVDGTRARLLLDTGALHSDLLTSSAASRPFSKRSVPNRTRLNGIGGALTTRRVRSVKVTVGEHRAVVDIFIMPGVRDDACPRDGALAMDVLASCVMVFEPGKVRGRCAP